MRNLCTLYFILSSLAICPWERNFNDLNDILIIQDEGSINNFRSNSIKYDIEKTKNPFPMKTEEIEFEINYYDNHNQ